MQPARAPPFPGQQVATEARANASNLRPTFSGRTGPDRPEDLSHNRARSMQQHAALLGAEHAVFDNLKRQ
jgi:hypothetical protein